MAFIPGVRFDITGASGSQGLLSPKDCWRAYILPRGAHASQDSTGTTITFDSASAASRFAANDWLQVGLSTDNIRQVSAVGGNSITISGAAVTVSENDRVFLIGSTQPTITGGSATYNTPNTLVRKRDDDAADLFTNSMITSNSDGLIQFWSEQETGPGVGATYFDAIIQDGNQANQGSVIDIELGTGDAREDWTVTAYPAGAVVSAAGITSPITVDAGHSFKVNDKFIIGTSETTLTTVTAVTATSLSYTGTTNSVAVGDELSNLGPDTGGATPNYDASSMSIYSDPDFGTAITNSRVTVDSNGKANYWTKGDGAHWELVRNRNGVPQEVIPGRWIGGRFNIADFGALIDGSTDDTGAVRAAKFAAETIGGEVWHPGGTAMLDDTTLATIQIDSGPCSFGGVPGLSIYKAGSSGTFSDNSSLFIVNASDVTFRGVGFDCDFGTVDVSHCVEIQGATRERIRLDSCSFDGANLYAVRCQGSTNVVAGLWVDRSEFDNNKWGVNIVSTVSSAIYVDRSNFRHTLRGTTDVRGHVNFDRDVADGHVTGCSLTGGRFGVAIASCTGIEVRGNHISGQDDATVTAQGIHIESTANEIACRQITVSDNIVSGCSNIGIAITGVSGPSEQITITNNIVYGCSSGGMLIDDAANTVVANNIVHTNDSSGIAVSSTSSFTDHVKVYDNIVYNNQVRALGNANINVGTNCGTVQVYDNDCYDNQASATVVRHIRVASGSTNVIVKDNIVDGNATTEAYAIEESIQQFANADATPSVSSGHPMFKTAATGVSVTNLDDGYDGQEVTLIAGSTAGVTLIADAGNFQLSAAWAPDTNGDNLTLILDSDVWTEKTRTDN